MPARVAPFEHYMFADDRAAIPMTFFLRFSFDGRVSLDVFASAVSTAQAENPLTRSVISGHPDAPTDDLSWVPAENPTPHISLADDGDLFPAYPSGEPRIDLTREVGIRFFLRETTAARTELLLQVHHSVSDAIGALGFMDDVLSTYDRIADGHTGRAVERDASLLETRHDVPFAPADARKRPFGSLGNTIKILKTPAMPIPPELGPEHWSAYRGEPFPAALSRRLSSERLQLLKAHAAEAGGTVNDVFLRDLFIALDRFHAPDNSPERIRLGMPVDMRTETLRAMSAANVVGMAFVERDRSDVAEGAQFLTDICAETRQIKARSDAAAFCRSLTLAGRAEHGLSDICAPSHCFCTAMLSNLVTPFRQSALLSDDGLVRAGGLTMLSCELLPPIRPLTSVAIGIATYGGQTHIAMNYDTRVLTEPDANRLLDLFVG